MPLCQSMSKLFFDEKRKEEFGGRDHRLPQGIPLNNLNLLMIGKTFKGIMKVLLPGFHLQAMFKSAMTPR